jgi:Ser/Thr protein kinase RdoA (MazF antagonist)
MNEEFARAAWREHHGRDPESVTRLATGSANIVFLIRDQGQFILRAAPPERREVLRGSLYWIDKLAPLALPIPRILASGIENETPYVILSYLEGDDLGAVYSQLTPSQKREIAKALWKAQTTVSALSGQTGYGYLSSWGDTNKKTSWNEVVKAHLARSRSWIVSCGHFDERFVDRVERFLPEFDEDFSRVEPQAFFDDATTKNLLVHNGRFSGIVDLDWLCFGDRLYNIALIRMALLELAQTTDYVDYLLEEENVTGPRRRIFSFYTLVFCVDFMGGIGMQFNRPEKPVVTDAQKSRLMGLFEELLGELV